jgi:hypothetical protein
MAERKVRAAAQPPGTSKDAPSDRSRLLVGLAIAAVVVIVLLILL